MDLTSILPLLMGGKNPEMAKILSAMNGQKSSGKDGGMNEMLASILANQNKGQKEKHENTSDSNDNANPFSSFMGGGKQTEILMNLMNSMNKQKPHKGVGLSVIQKIAPNDILGILLKYYNRRTI